jgi:hypothetical protein
MELLRRCGGLPKNRSLNSLREQAFRPWPGGWYFVTFDPAIVDSEPDKQQVLDWDLRLAVRFLKTGKLEPVVGSYRWVPGFSELIAAVNCRYEATGDAVEVALDTETMGLYPWCKGKDIVSIGFTCEAGKADLGRRVSVAISSFNASANAGAAEGFLRAAMASSVSRSASLRRRCHRWMSALAASPSRL